MAHSCSEKTPSPFSFHAKSMASQSPFARQLPPLTCFLITSKCCSRITPRFLKSDSLPSSLNVSRGNDIPFRENAACASSVRCTYVCNVVYCCTVCCTSTAVLLYGAPPPPQCSYCSRHRLSGRRSYLHPQFTAQLVGACSYWHLGTEHVFLWPCAYYYYFLRLKFLTTKFLTGDAVCMVKSFVSSKIINKYHRRNKSSFLAERHYINLKRHPSRVPAHDDVVQFSSPALQHRVFIVPEPPNKDVVRWITDLARGCEDGLFVRLRQIMCPFRLRYGWVLVRAGKT